ncbi:zinc-binding dehydrogenase [Sphingomonas sp.]|jgi:NADPH:quinone reductase-like Zn-dependent oxidoreductase|uniref:zinc-binding dehydrogenase n=1 Tax=Sphingomonas sp. TaxID=28214 RepID=UPI0039C9BE35
MDMDSLELRSLVTGDGTLRISLEPQELGEPGPGELLVRVEAAPINPSDLGLLLGPADVSTLQLDGDVLTAKVPQERLGAVAARLGQSLPVGNEGAGTVIAAGPDQQQLIGRVVGMIGGAMYAQHRRIAARDCIVLPEGATPAEGASLFVNPLTALGFVETMKAEGHKAIVHTAAASNLGQMLVRICLADGVPLVNIVRSAEQEKLLRDLGAEHVVDSSQADFIQKLEAAIDATGATIAFDAIGGGKLGSQIMSAMERVASRKMGSYSRYGSDSFKQLYIYGALDLGPTILNRLSFGFSWSVGGWLLTPFLQKAGMETNVRLRERVAREFRTTFASHYTDTISLRDALRPEVVRAYEQKRTGSKYLIDPSR